MTKIEISDEVYSLLEIMRENSLEDVTIEDVIKWMIHQICMDIEGGVI